MKIFHVNNQTEYSNWIPNAEISDDIQTADLVLFEGGEDVTPLIYGEPIGKHTSFNTKRDVKEVEIFAHALQLGKPILGVCRGSQLVCALSGGKLVQHQKNPSHIHNIYINDGESIIPLTSTHHQAQYPFGLKDDEYKILAYTKDLCEYHLDGRDKELNPPKEVEICYYPKTNALAIQPHPEFLWDDRENYKDTFEYLHDIFNKFINKKL
jgi:gamma-glutamyl-gamma-aminobutyrate hydrolase PuuD